MRKFEEGGGYFKTPVDGKKKADEKVDLNASGNRLENKESISLREKVFLALEKDGILKFEEGAAIFNTERFLAEVLLKDEVKTKKAEASEIANLTLRLNKQELFDALRDLYVVTPKEYQQKSEGKKDVVATPLFNVPDSMEEAFDEEKTMAKKYHLNFWDISKKIFWSNFKFQAKNGEEINPKEFALTTRLYREYGAHRDKTGQLLVFDKKRENYRPISIDWLEDNMSNFSFTEMKSSIHRFLRKECSHLLANGMLCMDDFGVVATRPSGELLREKKEMKKGEVNFFSHDGVKYYLGRDGFIFEGKKYPTENIKTVLLDRETVGIVVRADGKEEIKYIFPLLGEREKEEKKVEVQEKFPNSSSSEISARSFLNKREMNERIRPWLRTKESQKKREESPEQYAERISLLGDYNYLQKMSDEFSQKSGIGIHNLSWKEQQWLAAAAFELGAQGQKEQLLNFAKKYGLSGLKTFLTCEFDIENGKNILKIEEKIDSIDAMKIFQKVSGIVDLAQQKSEDLAGIIFKNKEQKISADIWTELLRKAHNIIFQFADELKSGNASEEKIQKLLADLEKSRIDIEIMAALLIATKKAGVEQNISGIKGVEMKMVGEKELRENPALVEKLTEMYRANNSHKSKEDLERLMGDFEAHKQHNPRFHLVYFDKDNKNQPKESLENLVGFMHSSSFDGQRELPESERYLGAMNINPLLQKFYFGENFLREIVEKELASGAKRLIAHVPENGPSHKIVKLFGFITVAEEGDYRDDDGKIIAKRLRVELAKK